MGVVPIRRLLLSSVRAFVALTVLVESALGCGVTDVNLGSDRVVASSLGGSDAGSPVTVTSDCPAVTEAELDMLRGSPCDDSLCEGGLGTPRVFQSSAEIEAVTAGRWQTCSGPVPWSSDAGLGPAVGIEFQAGCTLFLLYDTVFGVARGTEPSDQGTFNVVETTSSSGVTRSLELFFPTFTWSVDVQVSDCPHHMQLDSSDGGTTDFVAVTSTTPPTQ